MAKQGSKFLNRMQAALIRVSNRVQGIVIDDLLIELGDLLIDLTQYVDTATYSPELDNPVIGEINDTVHKQFYAAIRNMEDAPGRSTVKKGLEEIYKLSKSSVALTNPDGDAVLVAIAQKTLEIAQALGQESLESTLTA